jgi:phospholipid/cholesterol/gamma-HCH transport system substrate-binding protein
VDSETRLQLRTGVFALVVLVALGTVVSTLNREGGLFTRRYTLYGDFNNIEGLFVNSPVWLAGNRVGRVRDVSFLPPGEEHALRVELDVDARVRERIRSDSTATVRQSGVLGDMYVSISLGSDAGEPVEDGGMLATRDPLSFNELADKGKELFDNLVAVSASAERIVGSFEEEMGTESVASTLGALKDIVTEIRDGDGLLHAAIYDEAPNASEDLKVALAEMRAALGRLNVILAEVQEGDGMLHDFVYGAEETELSTLAAIGGSAERLESVLRKMDEGEGSLGALINDPTVYEDIKLLLGGAKDSTLLRGLINYATPDKKSSED